MQFSNDGLTVWYDTPDAPIAPGCVTVGVRPAHAANSVSIQLRSEGRFVRQVPAAPLGSPFGGGDQYFRADLPRPPDAAPVELLPVLRCGGRQAPSVAAAADSSGLWRRVPPAAAPAAPMATARPRAAQPRFSGGLDFLGTVTANLRIPAETIGVTAQGLRKTFYTDTGSCVGPKLNAKIRPGSGDWMLIQRDGVGWPSVRNTWETHDGALLFTDCYGVVDLGDRGYENALRDQYPGQPLVFLAPRFVTAHPDYAWLNRIQCVGIGHVDMSALEVRYDLHALTGGHFIDKAGTP